MSLTNVISNYIKPIREWYSEINSATLTGAIDVIVVEQEDGTFLSSPFHVRFGKLGVLKAKEKIVDIEVNNAPVDIHMKLDDNGAAFFVEGFEDEDEDVPPELATSPLPQLSDLNWAKDAKNSSVNRSLIQEFDRVTSSDKESTVAIQTDPADDTVDDASRLHEESSPEPGVLDTSHKGKLNRNKRKRRSRYRHSRNGSKSSLKEVVVEDNTPKEDNVMVGMEEEQEEVGEKDQVVPDPQEESITPIPSTPRSEMNAEGSLLLSRLPEAEAEKLESIINSESNNVGQERQKVGERGSLPLAMERGLQYYSEPEISPTTSPLASRATSPIMSDSEFETNQRSAMGAAPGSEQSWEWGKLPSSTTTPSSGKENTAADKEEAKRQEEENKGWGLSYLWRGRKKPSTSDQVEKVPGVYLDDLKGDDEEMMQIYVGTHRYGVPNNGGPQDEDAESGNGPSLPMSPNSVEGAIGSYMPKYDSSDDEQKNLLNVAISFCGGLDSDLEFSPLLFEQSKVSFDDFVLHLKDQKKDQNLFANPNLVVKIGEQFYKWEAACPIIMSQVLYGRPLSSDLISVLRGTYSADKKQPINSNNNIRKSSSWWPFGSRRENSEMTGSVGKPSDVEQQPPTSLTSTPKATSEAQTGASLQGSPRKRRIDANVSVSTTSSEGGDSDQDQKRNTTTTTSKFKKTLRLSSESIGCLNLKSGANEVQFSVTTAYQGTTRCNCHVYLWKHTDKIVISDIDGTITKSDVLGHVLPIIGRDWAQSGVASLFTKIVNNGYNIVYLSARAIGQASITKDYLASIKQGEMNLPDGPMFLNPTSLVSAFHREVIEKKPEEFKIACLRDIQKLFPEELNPFYAGYGNRVNDVWAYRAVGIPISRIFTINPKGELRHELTQAFQTSYGSQGAIVDLVFPPSGASLSPSTALEYSSFTYWRQPLPEIDVDQEKEDKKTAKNEATGEAATAATATTTAATTTTTTTTTTTSTSTSPATATATAPEAENAIEDNNNTEETSKDEAASIKPNK